MGDEGWLVEEPVYLIFEDLLELYAAIVGGTAQQAADHLRSRQALEGALARPRPTRSTFQAAACRR